MGKEDAAYTYTHPMEYYSAMIKEILPFAATWVKLEGIILSKVSQTKTNTVGYYFYVDFEKVKLEET